MPTSSAPFGITAGFAALADLFASARFTDATRLYAFVSDGLPELLVESFCGIETVCGAGAGTQWVVDVLSMEVHPDAHIRSWRWKQAALGIRQADGSTQWRSGYIFAIRQLGADGGLARYRLTLVPGVWLATQARRNRVFQNKPILQVIEEVLAPYASYVRWQIDTGVDTLLGDLAPRPMIVQYQESDYAFITRLLGEEGLGWGVAESSASGESPDFSGGAAHVLHLFANGDSFIQDASSAADGGIRWHRAAAAEESDALFDWRHTRSLRRNQTATVSWVREQKRAVVAVEPSSSHPSHVPVLEFFREADDSRQLTNGDAAYYARMEQIHIDSSQWQIGCASSVRSLAVHRWFEFLNYADFNSGGFGESALSSDANPAQKSQFNVLSVLHAGINNLPRVSQTEVQRSVALLAAELSQTTPHPALPYALADLGALLPSLLKRLTATGYANCAQLIPKRLPLQSWLPRQQHVPAGFNLPARVVGPNGETTPGNEEIYADATNRVRVAFFWQQGRNPDDRSTCWVPVLQRAAGATRGVHILPRIGQEVLVGFLHGQMDQPIVLASAYNGRGEGSRLAHEDRAGAAALATPFDQAVDARIAGQSNRVGHGNSPVWHGAAGVDHNHAAALLGIRSKEWGGFGYNQLLFDDSDKQLAVQVATTQYTTQLNLGHLRHRADNYRGSFRGTGFEMRTDAYGAVRGKQGVMLTTWGKDAATPTGDAAAAQRLMKIAADTGRNLSSAAGTHQTVRLISVEGVQSAKLSALRDDQAPLAAFAHALEGMVAGKDRAQALADAQSQSTTTDAGKVPHPTDPLLMVAGRGGIGLTATDIQYAVGHTHTELAGAHHYTGVAGQTRIHTGQGIGMLGGAIQANDGIGLQLIAGNGDVLVQAQSDTLTVASQKDMTMTAGQPIDFAAAKKIVIKTAAGATIEIGSGGINVTAPGSFTVHAASHQFVSGGGGSYALPVMPVAVIESMPQRQLDSTFAFDQLKGFAQRGTKAEFIALLVPIFGFDIPAKTYIKLYDGLRSGAIQNPIIKLMSGGHYPAEFDNDTREILVHWMAAKRAVIDRDEAWLLLTALLHEFGHYVDAVLRHDLADKNADGSSTLASDARDDEGAKFAYEIAFFDIEGSNSTVFANYTSPEYTGALKVNYREAHQAIRKSQGEEAQRLEGKSGSREHFGAGRGEHYKERPNESFGHESIEDALIISDEIFKKQGVLKQIYFGNWLRDFSQVLDPKIVRKPSASKDLTKYLSRDAWTKLVAVLAEDEFVKKPADKAIFAVTPPRLGVYRPTEHIDNPTNNDPKAVNPQTVDADFEPLPTKESVAVDPSTSMKRYIAASSTYMQSELNAAAKAGPTADGFRHFGAALHVLEDYFAHSNFVELSLRKMGHTNVLPWTSPAVGKHKFPVVTGMFDSEDVIASTAGLIADTVFKVKWEFQATKPGERNKGDRLMLILLSEHSDPAYLKTFEQFLYLRDQYAKLPGSEYIQRLMHYTFGMVGNVYSFIYGSLLQLIGNSVDDEQVLRTGDPNTNGSTNPSHSQLAKDHDNHAFHTLAVTLAKYAVTNVGKAMAASWSGDVTANPAKSAAAFLVHPMDCMWQDAIVANWANTHPQQVKRGASSTEWEALRKEHEKEVRDGIDKVGQRSKETWDYLNDNYEAIFGEKNQVKK